MVSKSTVYKNKDICVIPVATTVREHSKNVHQKKSTLFLERKGTELSSLAEDCPTIAPKEVLLRAVNFRNLEDGSYCIAVCTENRDLETTHMNSWNYRLLSI